MNSQPESNTDQQSALKVLMLGGTADARYWAQRAFDAGLFAEELDEDVDVGVKNRLIYSVAGLVRQPDLPCEVISGGFTQFGGLTRYLIENNIQLILDATHPFAQAMSTQAIASAAEIGIPCWRFRRPAWEQHSDDHWLRFNDWQSLCQGMKDSLNDNQSGRSVLVTVGQVDQHDFDLMIEAMGGELAFLDGSQQTANRCALRTAAPPRIELPEWVTWIKAIGPFDLEQEMKVFEEHNIDVLISKNSGGASTQAKIDAARMRGIPVYMLDRPEIPQANAEFDTLEEAVDGLSQWLSHSASPPAELEAKNAMTCGNIGS